MASLSNTLRVFSDGSLEVESVPSRKFWRVKHDATDWRRGLPEVFVLNSLSTPFGRDWQLLSFAMNPGMDPRKWRVVYDDHRAFMNNTGFSDATPRADYVNGLDLNSPLPRWDKTRVCGGALITGRVDGNDLVVDILDGRGPAPRLEELKPWHQFMAINAGTLTNFPQNGGNPVFIPLVGSGEARISLSQLEAI